MYRDLDNPSDCHWSDFALSNRPDGFDAAEAVNNVLPHFCQGFIPHVDFLFLTLYSDLLEVCFNDR
jgi:hypothetical protein